MKEDIHPEYAGTRIVCTYGNSSTTRSTLTLGEMRVDVCFACHPSYTGKQKILGTAGRVNRPEVRHAEHSMTKEVAAERKTTETRKAASETTAAK